MQTAFESLSKSVKMGWKFGLVLAGLVVLTALVWQGITASGNLILRLPISVVAQRLWTLVCLCSVKG